MGWQLTIAADLNHIMTDEWSEWWGTGTSAVLTKKNKVGQKQSTSKGFFPIPLPTQDRQTLEIDRGSRRGWPSGRGNGRGGGGDVRKPWDRVRR